MNPSVISISSSSDDDVGSDDEQYSDEEEELESEQGSDYTDSGDQEYDDDEEEDDADDSDEEECSDDSDDIKVHLHQGSKDLAEQSLNECKGYLRKHHLRVSGTKEECIQRIKEHMRLKDGSGESFYPRSSFSINCTGDACKGDVVLFRQRVYKKRGTMVGKRTVAGRIVKESYGTSKQQHTFTVEVLWSKPFKNLPPLSTLLVKGRNLYRFGTYRQPWKNEAKRLKVVGEKHTRGDEARHKRKLRTETASYNDKDRKRQKLSTQGSSHNSQQTRTDKHKSTKRQGAAADKHKSTKRQVAAVDKPKSTKRQGAAADKHKSTKRQGAAAVMKHRTAHKYSQQTNSYPSMQPTFHTHSNHFVYNRTTLPSLPPVGLPGPGHYNYGPPRTNHILYQPPGYYHYDYDRHVPRSRFG